MQTLKCRYFLIPLFITVFFVACSKTPQNPTSKTKVLHLYTWSDYWNPEVLKKFQETTGIAVDLNYFSSNEELLAKLQAGATGYDLIIPSGYMVRALKSLDLILPLSSGEQELDWPELKQLLPRFQKPNFDPNHQYVIPFAWGTTGLAVNRAKLKAKVDSWSWVFSHPELKGQITMLDDTTDVIGAALKMLGYSLQEKRPEALAKVKDLLKKQKPLLKAYSSETKPLLMSGEITIAQAYSCDVGQAQRKNPDVVFVLPKEGSSLWVDNMAIPKGAPSPEYAKTFMRFLLKPEIAALQSKFIFSNPVVNLTGYTDLLQLLIAKNLMPTDHALSKYEFNSDDPEQHELFQRLWTELKAE